MIVAASLNIVVLVLFFSLHFSSDFLLCLFTFHGFTFRRVLSLFVKSFHIVVSPSFTWHSGNIFPSRDSVFVSSRSLSLKTNHTSIFDEVWHGSRTYTMAWCINKFHLPPPGKPRGIFWVSQKPCPGAKFSCKKHGPWGKTTPTPGKYFRRSSQPFLLIGVEIQWDFCRNLTLKRIERPSNYSLVIPSFSTILKV